MQRDSAWNYLWIHYASAASGACALRVYASGPAPPGINCVSASRTAQMLFPLSSVLLSLFFLYPCGVASLRELGCVLFRDVLEDHVLISGNTY